MKRLLSLFTVLVLALSCVSALAEAAQSGLSSLTATGKMELEYAAQFSVDYFEGGYALITNSDGARFLTIPEGAGIPEGLDEDIVTLQLPLQNLLISSTPVTSLINAVGALDAVTMTTQEYDGWYIDDVKAAMDAEKLNYLQDSLDVVFVPTDNYVLSKVDIYVNDELVDSYFNEENNSRLTDTLQANNGEITYTLNAEGRRQEIKVITTDAAGNVSGYDIEGNLIDMSDDPEILTWAPVVTRNIAVQYFNIKPLFYGSIGTAGGLLLLFLLLKRRKKDEEEA